MHTIDTLNYDDFEFIIENHHVSLEDIFPGFNEKDRVGVVVRQAGGGLGASALLMAALTRFYDFYRPQLGDEPGKLRIYPEFFVFHVEKRHMNHTWMDVWPPHKEVIVQEDDPEQILETINDRGITRLLVENMTPTVSPTFLRETVSSAESRIISTVAYSPTGRVNQGDIRINSCPAAEDNVLASIKRSEELSSEEKEKISQSRQHLYVDGCISETYRRINLSETLRMLSPVTEPGRTTRKYLNILGVN
ncbi:hypothetical protein [Alteribacillus sp. YIM 98480]|uniref:hypothetical protein n=1 Tax=Alteribacillus sp. YIM 98480 TaxID=2606599 RepID=UPI00131D1F0E|nr:hypothetical protein [Alteribacillus sp. YIM 98480]